MALRRRTGVRAGDPRGNFDIRARARMARSVERGELVDHFRDQTGLVRRAEPSRLSPWKYS
jgi:hypothetical protein